MLYHKSSIEGHAWLYSALYMRICCSFPHSIFLVLPPLHSLSFFAPVGYEWWCNWHMNSLSYCHMLTVCSILSSTVTCPITFTIHSPSMSSEFLSSFTSHSQSVPLWSWPSNKELEQAQVFESHKPVCHVRLSEQPNFVQSLPHKLWARENSITVDLISSVESHTH